MITVPPGIYAPDAYPYEQIDAVNQSTLVAIRRSPLHYRHRVEHPLEATAPMRLGSLAHTAILEPHELERRYAVWDGDRRGNAYRDFEAAAATAGRAVVKRDELEAAQRIAEAVRASALARRYLVRGLPERILVWRDEDTGIVCKGRIDWLSTSVADVGLDLKTARDVGPWAFSSAFASRNYDFQAAFYADGYKSITGRELYQKCVAVENVEPHDVVIYDLLEVIDVGRELYREALERLAECRRSGQWAGQSPLHELTLRLPRWRDPDDESNALADLGVEP